MAQKYAVLVGCNYSNTDCELTGCINDANSMYYLLTSRLGFSVYNVAWLTDNPRNAMPTATNIKSYLNLFLSRARFGDVVFFYFAGHGTTICASHSSSGRDEQAIVACDFNFITSLDLRQILNRAPYGVQFVVMSDSCHSGGLIDNEQEQIGPHRFLSYLDPSVVDRPRMISFEVLLQQHSLENHIHDPHQVSAHFNRMFGSNASLVFRRIPPQYPLRPDQGILLSGCQSNELCGEREFDGINHGVFTSAVLNILRTHIGRITNHDLVLQARRFLEEENFENQHPCLYSSDRNAYLVFL